MDTTDDNQAPLDTDHLAWTVRMLQEAIDQISARLKTEDTGSYSDLARLIQLKKELEERAKTADIREIIVTWIDPNEPEPTSVQ